MLGVFSLATGGEYRAANVAKNFVSSLNGLAATLVFANKVQCCGLKRLRSQPERLVAA